MNDTNASPDINAFNVENNLNIIKITTEEMIDYLNNKESSLNKTIMEHKETYDMMINEHHCIYANKLKLCEDNFNEKTKILYEDNTASCLSIQNQKDHWDQEKRAISSAHTFEPCIKVDVGGSLFTTTLTTLTRFPETMLGAMFSGRHKMMKTETGYYFIDRDGTQFRHILNFLRCPENFVVNLDEYNLDELKTEVEYYGLNTVFLLNIIKIDA